MADKQTDKQAASKRRVKDPETFRQRAIKASEASGKPSRTRRVGQVAGKALKPVAKPFKPVGRAAQSAGKLKPFKIVGKFFRLLGRILLPRYIRNSFKELKLVVWPSWKQSRKLTFAVLVFAILFGVFIAGVDYGFDKAFRAILLK